MKLPLVWLKDYVDTGALTPERLGEILTLSGTKVEELSGQGAEAVLELEITTNRPDCLSIRGLSREVAALNGRRAKFPAVAAFPAKKDGRIPIRVEDRKGCPLYTAQLLEGVTVRPAPPDAQKRLALAGTRAIHNVVDVTNYVLFEMGQPLHAFDFDKIQGGAIVVRRAAAGEKFTGLDDVEYTLDPKTLVIADASGPIAMAGVIGGKGTEVTAATKNILLESAYFDPLLVRQASRRHKVSTESSYRFERGVDASAVAAASQRAAGLILEWAGGKRTASNSVSARKPEPARRVTLRLGRLERLLGAPVASRRAASILTSLGFAVKPSGKAALAVTVPAGRRDVAQEADLIEEVLRIEGFDKIPVSIPTTRHTGRKFGNGKAVRLLELKKYLAASGLSEIMTYSLLPERALRDSGFSPEDAASGIHRVTNAGSAEQAYFRPSLLPGMLGALLFNVHRKAESLRFFEIGNRYRSGREETVLAVGLYGGFEENWQRRSRFGFYDLKGFAANLLGWLGAAAEWRDETGACPRYENRAGLYADGAKFGTVANVRPALLKKWDLPHDVFFAEIDLDRVFALADARPPVKARPVPKFPSVRRDVAFIVEEGVPVRELEQTMREAAKPHLSDVQLFDQFNGKGIPAGKRSLAFSLAYQKETATFTDEEIQALQAKVGEALKTRFRAEFR
ncbi:MAG TPA: phenylalanine--tRNA ligase subunit beta [Candidatus Eisenbacteria bacterium]|jgi:phenylalanyl-tRNA synthetase beta chain|nr:phenylalanine--tRNA ligase subunit beta [Candidatus Eisenbacteria bacterium]